MPPLPANRPVRTPISPPPREAPIPAPAPAPAPRRLPVVPEFADLAALREHVRGCARCILREHRAVDLPWGGAERSEWVVLTLYGWADDAQAGALLSGGYAAPFLDLARRVGLPEPAVLPVLACVPRNPADTTVQGNLEAVRCRPHWSRGLKLSGAKAVLVLDQRASQLARGPGAMDWSTFRGTRWELEGLPAVSTHHPARLARQPTLAPEVESDLRQILSILEASA